MSKNDIMPTSKETDPGILNSISDLIQLKAVYFFLGMIQTIDINHKVHCDKLKPHLQERGYRLYEASNQKVPLNNIVDTQLVANAKMKLQESMHSESALQNAIQKVLENPDMNPHTAHSAGSKLIEHFLNVANAKLNRKKKYAITGMHTMKYLDSVQNQSEDTVIDKLKTAIKNIIKHDNLFHFLFPDNAFAVNQMDRFA